MFGAGGFFARGAAFAAAKASVGFSAVAVDVPAAAVAAAVFASADPLAPDDFREAGRQPWRRVSMKPGRRACCVAASLVVADLAALDFVEFDFAPLDFALLAFEELDFEELDFDLEDLPVREELDFCWAMRAS